MADAVLKLPFGGEERTFSLAIGQVRAIEAKCDLGLGVILAQLHPLVQGIRAGLTFPQLLQSGLIGTWRVDHYREVILQALIPSVGPTMATALVTTYVDPYGPLESAPLAYEILVDWFARMAEAPQQAAGEPKPARRKRTRKGASTSPESTPAQP